MVGAGFASGQEIMQFFVFAGPVGIISILGAGVLFFYMGNLIMQMSFRSRTATYQDLLYTVFGKSVWYLVFDVMITFSYFGVLVVMTSGAGALFAEFVGLPFWVGGLFILIPTFLTVLWGRGAVIMAISVVVPLMIGGIVLIATLTLWQNPLSLADFPPVEIARNPLIQGVPLAAPGVAALLYVAYNILLTLAVLTTLGQAASSSRVLRGGALLGALGIGLASLSIFAALACSLPESSNWEIPMLFLATRLHPLLAVGYSAVLLLEIYTSALCLLYGLTERLFKGSHRSPARSRSPAAGQDRKKRALAILFICAGALLCSFFGFSNMVASVYPVLGLGSAVLCGLLWRRRHGAAKSKQPK